MSNIHLSKIAVQDIATIHQLALNNDGNKDFTLENFKHWYLQNPTQSCSMWKAELDGKIEGYATTNNFIYNYQGKENLVALPQNVLTSENIRGKGIFGKLYHCTEEENKNELHVDFFLTSTGAMSTPIFLQKFGYLRAACPDVVAIFPSPILLLAKKNYKTISDINSIHLDNIYTLDNARKKTIQYYKWRYANCTSKTLKILEVIKNGNKIGYAFLIVQKKKGINTLMLADIISTNKENYSDITKACTIFCSKHFFAVLIMFQLHIPVKKNSLQLSFKNKFNFLAKGNTQIETEALSQTPFNYFLGDLDYFWS